MKKPLTSSAGWVAHHPTTPTLRPAAEARFQTAGTAREAPEIGAFCPLFGSTSWKSSTRCRSGPTPVAIVVQMTGERIGTKLVIRVVYPSAERRFQLGMRPSAVRRSRISKSRPSRPIQRTGLTGPCGRRVLDSLSAVSTGGSAADTAPETAGAGETEAEDVPGRPRPHAMRAA